MTNLEGLMKYLEESGLGDKIENLKPGDSFGVEIPVDEASDKWLRFWLSAEGGEKVEYVTVDVDGILHLRITTNDEKIDNWIETSGILEFVKMMEQANEILEAGKET